MKHRHALTVLGLLLTLSLVLSACGTAATPTEEPAAAGPAAQEPTEAEAPAAEPVTITYWHTMSDPETAQLELVVAAFEETNPGLTVETTRFAYDDFKPALLTALAGGDPWAMSCLDVRLPTLDVVTGPAGAVPAPGA